MLCNYQAKHPPHRSIIIKMHGIFTPRLKSKLRNVSGITWSWKEGAYIWSIWHKAFVVNERSARYIRDIENKYHFCTAGTA